MKSLDLIYSLFIVSFIALICSSCTDKCESTRTYRVQRYVGKPLNDIRDGIKNAIPRELENPSKLYLNGHYIFISEAKKGVHVINNLNPENPINESFIEIPGVLDMAIKNDILYVDSYMDVVALDISNPKNTKEVGREINVFQNGNFDDFLWYYNEANNTLNVLEWEIITETVLTDCGVNLESPPIFYNSGPVGAIGASGIEGSLGTNGNNQGSGGSMARFTISSDYLYAVSSSSLHLMDITNKQSPKSSKTIDLGWGIETIFPYEDKLFVGSNSGMFIFDNSNPADPKQLSIFQHVRACDPVVVQNDIAYVTLRSGFCGASPNRLEIVDVKDARNPKLIKDYAMENPHGLSVVNNNLFLCEGDFGLKSFDISNVDKIELEQHIKDVKAFDVIALDKSHLLMVGKGGLYQYDFSDPKKMKQISVIPVKN